MLLMKDGKFTLRIPLIFHAPVPRAGCTVSTHTACGGETRASKRDGQKLVQCKSRSSVFNLVPVGIFIEVIHFNNSNSAKVPGPCKSHKAKTTNSTCATRSSHHPSFKRHCWGAVT